MGKAGYVYLLNRDNLGGFQQGSGGGDAVVQRLGFFGGVWSRPAVWPGDGGYLYIPTSSGASGGGTFDIYKYGLNGTGQPSLSRVAMASEVFGWGSGAPVVTSNHTENGSAIVWLTRANDRTGAGGQLRAYEAVPQGGELVEIFNESIGTASNYSVPGVGAGRIYVGNREGQVFAFGSPVTPVLTGSPVSFGVTTTGESSTKTATLTATEALTLTSLTAGSSQYKVGTPSIALPAHLVAGQSISVPVTFSPTQAGLVSSALKAKTEAGAEASISLSGTGRLPAAALGFSPPVVSFGGTAVGRQPDRIADHPKRRRRTAGDQETDAARGAIQRERRARGGDEDRRAANRSPWNSNSPRRKSAPSATTSASKRTTPTTKTSKFR